MTVDNLSIKRLRNLLIATTIMTFLLITMGGIVRVTGSGLGCPDWPRCFGQWIPPLRTDAIIEYMHRLAATLTSPLILASAVIGWRNFRHHKLIYRPLIAAVLLLGVQGLLGGVVVLLEVPPNLVALHFGIALLILALVIFPATITHGLYKQTLIVPRLEYKNDFSKLSLYTLFAIFVILVSGAVVASSNSTEACSGWPLCNGVFIPTNLLGWIHMSHRAIVSMSAAVMIYLYSKTIKENAARIEVKYAALATILLFFIQAFIGALKVSTRFPVYLLALHVAVAAAVWASAVIFASLAGTTSSTD